MEKDLKEKQKRLQEIQNSISTTSDIWIERDLRSEIEKLMFQEEIMWTQKAQSNWIIYEDRNTRYFQTVVK